MTLHQFISQKIYLFMGYASRRGFQILLVCFLSVGLIVSGCDSGGSNSGNGDSDNKVVVTNDITSDTKWTSENTYILDGVVFVENDATLTIDPGTNIKARLSSEISNDDEASALIVKTNGKIDASGTASSPIIFTSTEDDLSDPSDLGPDNSNLWSGVVLLGSAPTSENTAIQIDQIEGIDESVESASFGSSSPDPSDDSGTLKHVSIRHGGRALNGLNATASRIASLTLGAVGNGTTISHVEVFASVDDGVRWIGGNVHADHLVAAFCSDNAFEWDTGFRGTGQYWFSVQSGAVADHAGGFNGYDGDTSNDEYSDPVVSNVTFIGPSEGFSFEPPAARFSEGSAGEIYNSIFSDFPKKALRIDDLGDGTNTRWNNDQLVVRSNVFFNFGANDGADGDPIADIVFGTSRDSKIAANNSYVDPKLGGIDRGRNGKLDPQPTNGSPVSAENPSNFENTNGTDSDYVSVSLSDIEDAGYVGAFDPGASSLWTTGWTKLSQDGYMVE